MTNSTLKPWEQKAHRVIAELSRKAYLSANPNARGSEKRFPYRIPPIADELVEILGMHDRKEAEERAKAIFIQLAIIPELADDRKL